MLGFLKRALERYTMRTGRLRAVWMRVCVPDSYRYADYLRRHGGFYAIGPESRINRGATITDPAYVRVGRNCAIAKCDIIGHNGIIGVFQNVYPEKLDAVGHTDIRDNSFVGHGSIVLPGVTIGPNSIVAAGAVVAKDVPPGTIVAGVPAKVVGKTEDYYQSLLKRSRDYPWYHIIEKRVGDFDPALEPELKRIRQQYFFGHGESTADIPGG